MSKKENMTHRISNQQIKSRKAITVQMKHDIGTVGVKNQS